MVLNGSSVPTVPIRGSGLSGSDFPNRTMTSAASGSNSISRVICALLFYFHFACIATDETSISGFIILPTYIYVVEQQY